jgi:DNA-binding response OmpR family regulator
MPESLNAWVVDRAKGSVLGCREPRPPDAEKRGILLISDDASLGESLRCAAAPLGRTVVQVDGLADALQNMCAGHPVAVLLDLDLPSQVAWEVADCLLQEQSCPPLILLTARSDQFDLSTAVRAGALIDKTTDHGRLLEAVDQTLAVTCSAQAERNAIQRVIIRWLRPCSWSVPITPAHRFWGLNE